MILVIPASLLQVRMISKARRGLIFSKLASFANKIYNVWDIRLYRR